MSEKTSNYEINKKIPSFYDKQINKVENWKTSTEIEILRLKRDILRLEAQAQNWNSLNYQTNNETYSNNIDFRIKWWIVKRKVKTIKMDWLKIKWLKNTIQHLRLWHTSIIKSNTWDNIYEIYLESLDWRYKKTIEIEYYWEWEIYSTDNYSRRYNKISFRNNSTLEIKQWNEIILLKVDFYNDYNHHRNQHNRNNNRRKDNYYN